MPAEGGDAQMAGSRDLRGQGKKLRTSREAVSASPASRVSLQLRENRRIRVFAPHDTLNVRESVRHSAMTPHTPDSARLDSDTPKASTHDEKGALRQINSDNRTGFEFAEPER